MIKQLKSFQTKAVQTLSSKAEFILNNDDLNNKTLVLKSPTGSGKTFTTTKLIEKISKDYGGSICFIWISIGSGELQKQSFNSVKSSVDNSFKCTLLTDNSVLSEKGMINNEIVFLNWEKIYSKNKNTNEYKNSIMKESENTNFQVFLKNTRDKNKKIVLIIDEAHRNAKTERALELRDDVISPSLTIEVSATPIFEKNSLHMHVVDIYDVINEGMIKKNILINDSIDSSDETTDSFKIVISEALKKREVLLSEINKRNLNINPLILFQVPDGADGDETINRIKTELNNYSINENNGNLAIWLNGVPENFIKSEIVKNNSEIEGLIFKKAISTGWDCPRAWILVKLREIKSQSFDIQTVGRILRTPFAKHFDNDLLDNGYVYTNLEKITVSDDAYSPNIIKVYKSIRGKKYSSLKIKSNYKSRGGLYNDIESDFYDFWDKFIINKYGLKCLDKGSLDHVIKMNVKILEQKMISSENIESSNQNIELDVEKLLNTININININDRDKIFKKFISENISNFSASRSVSTVKMTLYRFIKSISTLDLKPHEIQNIILINEKLFSDLLFVCSSNYRDYKNEKIKNIERWTETEFDIPSIKMFNSNTYTVLSSKKSIYQPFYVFNTNSKGTDLKWNKLEASFIEFLDNCDKVEWFWQNGAEHMESNFGIKVEKTNSTFQPDFIVKFSDGKIGIFDTKGENYNVDDTKVKAEALQRYLKIANSAQYEKNIIGGIVILEKNKFLINNKDVYKRYKEKPLEWNLIEDII